MNTQLDEGCLGCHRPRDQYSVIEPVYEEKFAHGVMGEEPVRKPRASNATKWNFFRHLPKENEDPVAAKNTLPANIGTQSSTGDEQHKETRVNSKAEPSLFSGAEDALRDSTPSSTWHAKSTAGPSQESKTQQPKTHLWKFRTESPAPSEASSVFSSISTPSTNSSNPPKEIEISIWHLVELLTAQKPLDDLCQRGFQRENTTPERFANNLRRMLKTFGNDLRTQSQSFNIRLVAQLIVRDSRRMAAQIRARYDPMYKEKGSKLADLGSKAMTEAERRFRIDHFIHQLSSTRSEAAEHLPDVDNNDSDSEDDSTLDFPAQPPRVSSLDEIEAFILSSEAFSNLLVSITGFLKVQNPRNPYVEIPQGSLEFAQSQTKAELARSQELIPGLIPQLHLLGDGSNVNTPGYVAESHAQKRSIWLKIHEALFEWLTTLERPKKGVKRIKYTCVFLPFSKKVI